MVLAVVFVYQPVWHAGFIWDDDVYVINNRLLTAPDGLQKIWFSTESPSQYFPLTYTVLRLERALWGLNAAGYHWVNILVHAANALLVWTVLQRLKVPGAWFGAALFALHPVQVETVAWITELKNLLALFFSLLTLLAWIKFTEEEKAPPWQYYGLALVFYALALFSKTTACALPAALVLTLWLQKKPLAWPRWLQIAPFLLLGLAMGALSVWWERHHQNTFGEVFAIGPVSRLLIASRAVWFYLGKLIWPVHLSFSYERWGIDPRDPLQWIWLAAGLALVVVVCLTRRFYGRGVEVAGLYFVATLSPVIGFIMEYTFKYSFVADHYQYAACIGPLALVGATACRTFGSSPKPTLFTIVRAVILLPLAVLTWEQSNTYIDADSVWRATLKQNPASTMARNNLGRLLLDKGQTDDAMALFQSVLNAHPDDLTAQYNMGDALLAGNRMDEAVAHFQRAMELAPSLASIPYRLGEVYLKEGRMDLAIRSFDRAIQLHPDYAAAFCNLGYALLQSGHRDEALAAYTKSLELDPNYALAHNDLGNILLQMGRRDEAMSHFQRAVEIQPDFAEAHFNLAGLYLSRGNFKDAASQYELALAANPNLAPACNRLARLLATAPDPSLRDPRKAIGLAQRADQLAGGKSVAFIDTLAAACAADGQFDLAVKTIERALALPQRDPSVARALEDEKTAYQAGRLTVPTSNR